MDALPEGILDVQSPDEFESAFAAMTRVGASTLFVLTDASMLERHVSDIVTLALQHRLPAMYPWRTYPDAGGLMSYSMSLTDAYRRGATYVDKILWRQWSPPRSHVANSQRRVAPLVQ